MWKRKAKYIEFANKEKRIRISFNVLKLFRKYEQKNGNPESGGILLGIVYDDCDYIIKITLPNKLDARGMNFFNRSKIPAQKQINKSWKRSKGYLIYLGEWHTHSEINPKPSVIDREMIEKTFEETKMEIDYLYLIIIGKKDTMWIGRKDTDGLIEYQ